MKNTFLFVLAVMSLIIQSPQKIWAVVPPATSLQEPENRLDQRQDERLEKAIQDLESQQSRLQSVVSKLEEEYQQLEKKEKKEESQDGHPVR